VCTIELLLSQGLGSLTFHLIEIKKSGAVESVEPQMSTNASFLRVLHESIVNRPTFMGVTRTVDELK